MLQRYHGFNQADFNDDAAVLSMQHTTVLQLLACLITVPLFSPSLRTPPPLNKWHYKKGKI